MTDLSMGEAARAIGVSVDTLRRWDGAGKLRTTRDSRNRRQVPATEVERLRRTPTRHRTDDSFSARNRFPGTVTSVEVAGVMALVEIQAGPHLITAAITRDAVEELGLVEGARAAATVKATSVMIDREGSDSYLCSAYVMIGTARMGAVESRASRHLAVLAVAVACLAGLAGCGGGGDDSDQLVVSAAASLDTAFNDYVDAAGIDAKMSFAGSDELAAQIRQGVKPDVYAAANTTLPDQLHEEGLVGESTVFATNTLVLAVPEDSQIESLDDLAKPGTSIVMGDPTVPVGSYTREVLDHLPAGQREAIYDNVRSEEPNVSSISGKLTQGAADAGLVYITDVTASSGQLKAIQLPADLQPNVAYGAAVVTGAKNPEGARRFIDGLLSGDGATALQEAGFKPPPG